MKNHLENRIRPTGKTRLILLFQFRMQVVTMMALMLTSASIDVKKNMGHCIAQPVHP